MEAGVLLINLLYWFGAGVLVLALLGRGLVKLLLDAL